MARQWQVPGGPFLDEDGEEAYLVPGYGFIGEDQTGAPPAGGDVPPLWHHYDKNIRSG